MGFGGVEAEAYLRIGKEKPSPFARRGDSRLGATRFVYQEKTRLGLKLR